jgi:ferredoxin|tara:strand:+ start:671 stop:973 length:303 start_codon:yes stop_codon:yes gene_type:complete
MYELIRTNVTHVVTEACVMHKYQDCVAVCPVEAFKESENYLVIDPDECIDCAACVPECPVDAIFADTDLPEDQEHWLEKNENEAPELEIAEGDSPVLADS